MVTLKPKFIATNFPGYFFNVEDDQLYSLKVDGVLKPLKFVTPNYWNKIDSYPIKLKDGTKVISKGGYNISVKGRRKFYPIERLKELEHTDSVVPVKGE
jgi:hypothetical protein